MITLSKYTPLNHIGDVWEPLYNQKKVYISKDKVLRSKHDIHLRFPKVNETSEYYGDWYLPRKKITRIKKTYNNNGKECYVIDFEAFERLQFTNKDERAFV